MNWMLGLLREGIMTIIIVSGPVVLVAALIGLVVGIVQATTQVQEEATKFGLKSLAVFALIIFMGVWMFSYLRGFAENTIGKSFKAAVSERQSVLTSNDFAQTYARALAPEQAGLTAGQNLGAPLADTANTFGALFAGLQPNGSLGALAPLGQVATNAAQFPQPNVSELNLTPRGFDNLPSAQNRASTAFIPSGSDEPKAERIKPVLPSSLSDSSSNLGALGDSLDPPREEWL